MFNYWWLFFGTLFFFGLVGGVTSLILGQRYLNKFGRSQNLIERMVLERRFYWQVLFSSPEWIRQDKINWRLQSVSRITTILYLGGIVGFLIVALSLS